MLGEYRSHEDRKQSIERSYSRKQTRGYVIIIIFVLLSTLSSIAFAEAKHADIQRIIELCHF